MVDATDRRLRLDDQVCFSLYAAARAMTARYRPLLADLGLTYPQYLVMLVLWEHGQRSVRELSDVLGMDYGTLSPLVRRLESAGLVERRRRAADERVVDVRLTERGEGLRERAADVPEAVVRGTDVRRLAALKTVLDDVRSVLEEPADDAHAPPA
ncbi:MarR family winged helix-turn-helix transcriptional regulator [Thalassiella azotivora]